MMKTMLMPHSVYTQVWGTRELYGIAKHKAGVSFWRHGRRVVVKSLYDGSEVSQFSMLAPRPDARRFRRACEIWLASRRRETLR